MRVGRGLSFQPDPLMQWNFKTRRIGPENRHLFKLNNPLIRFIYSNLIASHTVVS